MMTAALRSRDRGTRERGEGGEGSEGKRGGRGRALLEEMGRGLVG